jgi:hypothetical protein
MIAAIYARKNRSQRDPLEAPVQDFCPRGEAVGTQAPSGQDQRLPLHQFLQRAPARFLRLRSKVLLPEAQQIEGQKERRGCQIAVVEMPQPFKPRDEILMRHFAVERERVGLQRLRAARPSPRYLFLSEQNAGVQYGTDQIGLEAQGVRERHD